MITETAKVIAVNNKQVTLESKVKSSCSGCQQVDNCGSGQVAKAFPHRSVCFETYSELPVSVGDNVLIGINEGNMLTTAWQVYIWPLLGLILAGGIGQLMLIRGVFASELIAIIAALVGGYMGHLLAKYWQRCCQYEQKLQPKILKIMPKSIAVSSID